MNTATSNNSITNTGNNIVINGSGGSGTSVSVTSGNQSIVSNTSATSTSNGGNNVNTATSNNVINNSGNSVVINNNNSNNVNTSTSNNSINNSGNTVVINNGGNTATTTSNNLLGSEPLPEILFFPTDGLTNADGSTSWTDHQCTQDGTPVNFSVCCDADVDSTELYSGDTTSPCPVYSYDTVSDVCSVVSPTNPFMPNSLVYVPT